VLSSFNDPFEGQVITLHDELTHDMLADELCKQIDEMALTGEKVPLPKENIEQESPIGIFVALYHHGHMGDITITDFKASLKSHIGRLKINSEPSGYVQRVHARLADYIYVLCFTSNEHSLLMWSHYANHHRGVLLTFDPQKSPSLLQHAEPVRYTRHCPRNDGLSRTVASHLKRTVDAKIWVDNTLLTKSDEWSYEQESRVLVGVNEREDEGLVSFPSETLVSIVLGCRMTEGEAKELADLASERFPDISISKAVRDPKDFKLNYVNYLSK